MINLASRLTGANPHAVAIAVHGLLHIMQITIMARKSLMARILVMAEEIDDQEIFFVVIVRHRLRGINACVGGDSMKK